MSLPLASSHPEPTLSLSRPSAESGLLAEAYERSFRYDPPSRAHVWDDPRITLPTDNEFRAELRAYQAQITDPDLILFAVPTEEPPPTQVALRLSSALGITAATAAILYFFGHVIAAWAMGRLG